MILNSRQAHWLSLLQAMTEKEISARYKNALLGFLWIIINPLLQMVVIGFIFQFFVPTKVDNYFLYLFSGLLPWLFFSYSITKTTPTIVYERNLIKKSAFPRETVILSIVLSNLFHFIISLALFLLVLVVGSLFFHAQSLPNLLWYIIHFCYLLLPISWIFILTSGLSLLFSALNVRYRDVNFMVQALMPLGFYATPIIYSLPLLPAKVIPWLYFNPMTAITEYFHAILLGTSTPSLPLTLLSLAMTTTLAIGGWLVFSTLSKNFDDWI